jgi:hypothetical protein
MVTLAVTVVRAVVSIIMPLSMQMRIKTWQAKHSELKEAWKSI